MVTTPPVKDWRISSFMQRITKARSCCERTVISLSEPVRLAAWKRELAGLYLTVVESHEHGGLHMFGMLDYRAYKLLWLISLPFRIVWRLIWFVVIAIEIAIGHWTEYPSLAQIVIAYVAMEVIGLIASIVWALLINWPLYKVFFWLVDVVPSKGENARYRAATALRAVNSVCTTAQAARVLPRPRQASHLRR